MCQFDDVHSIVDWFIEKMNVASCFAFFDTPLSVYMSMNTPVMILILCIKKQEAGQSAFNPG